MACGDALRIDNLDVGSRIYSPPCLYPNDPSSIPKSSISRSFRSLPKAAYQRLRAKTSLAISLARGQNSDRYLNPLPFQHSLVVTGGARTGLNREELTIGGLGKEFLKAFALSGAKSLAVLDRDLPVAKKACDEITYAVAKELGIKDEEVSALNAWGCDVTNPEDVHSTIDEIAKHFGGHIDVFVGAAGTVHFLC